MDHAWEGLGRVSPRALGEARVAQHEAAQLVAAVGRCLVPAASDDGHTSLEWTPGRRAFAGQAVPASRPWRATLRPEDLVLVLVDGDEERALPLAGRTLADAEAWLGLETDRLGAPAGVLRFETPYRLPVSNVSAGGPFALPPDGSPGELTRWFANADALLRAVARAWPGASPVRVWPHHFDVGSVLPLGGDRGESSPSIGVGMSPGDDAIAEPYCYVTLWPLPSGARPALPVGRWHTEGWTGALLAGTELAAAGDGDAQRVVATRFLSEAIECLRAWHAGGRGTR